MRIHRFLLYIKIYRPHFLAVSVAPVVAGSVLGFAVEGSFDTGVFALALLAMIFLHLGGNAVNDYFDHLSGNDAANTNYNAFSGGSRYIQDGLISARTVLLQGWLALAIGSGAGLIIVLITGSLFILVLGIVGAAGAYFYTAEPVKIGYRGFGEIVIGFLFGILPVYGSYYLQTYRLDVFVILPAGIIGMLDFLVILINEFPDYRADAAVNKKTLVVTCGITKAVLIYRVILSSTYLLAAGMLFIDVAFRAGLLYLFTLPLGSYGFRAVNAYRLRERNNLAANKLTILLHSIGSLALVSGFLITILTN